MAEFKKITEVEVIKTLNDEDTVLVEQDGAAKRIHASDIIPNDIVKSVNGNAPDKNGNVQMAGPDWNENDESSPAYINNRTHWAETEFEIRWDGSTDGRTVVTFPDGRFCVHISNITDPAMLIGATCNGTIGEESQKYTFSDSDFQPIEDSFYGGASPFAIVTHDNAIFNDLVWPKAGVYCNPASFGETFDLTITREIVHKIDPKFVTSSASFIKCSNDVNITDGPYNFVNPEDFSIIGPATNSKVRQAMRNGIVYAVTGESHGSGEFAQLINGFWQDDGSGTYTTYAFGGSRVNLQYFSIYDE